MILGFRRALNPMTDVLTRVEDTEKKVMRRWRQTGMTCLQAKECQGWPEATRVRRRTRWFLPWSLQKEVALLTLDFGLLSS